MEDGHVGSGGYEACPACKNLMDEARAKLVEILKMFSAGARGTLIIRAPEYPTPYVVTNDDLEDALAAAKDGIEQLEQMTAPRRVH